VLAIPSQRRGIADAYGLTRQQLDREAWAIARDGGMYAGTAAVNRSLAELGGVCAVLAAAYRLPLVKQVEDSFYRWFAGHRAWFARWGVTPECEDPESDGDCTAD
jgi:predicted DCC family thiol-disulfide oxidoreductase YuxK